MHIVTINMNTCSHYEHEHDDMLPLRTRLHVGTMVMNTKSHLKHKYNDML